MSMLDGPLNTLNQWLVYLDMLGCYTGSATGKGGGTQRLVVYDSIRPVDSYIPSSDCQMAHTQFAAKHRRQMNFRVLAPVHRSSIDADARDFNRRPHQPVFRQIHSLPQTSS